MRRKALLALVLGSAVGGCANVSIRKVGEDGKVSGPSGIRFYRNRPYVALHEPFVVGAKPYIVGGEVSPDGRYLLINDVDLDKCAKDALGLVTAYRVKDKQAAVAAVESRHVVVAAAGDASKLSGGPQGAASPAGAPSVPTSGTGKDATEVSSVAQEQTGQLNMKATNDNAAFAITRLRRYFDVVFLPDFDEDYVVEGSSGVGNASVSVALGQSWSLQGIDASVDNGPLARRLLDLMDHGASLLTSLSPAAAAAASTSLAGKLVGAPQGSTLTDGILKGEFSAGTPVSVKITLVRIAAPGLYKILKPKELREFGLLGETDCKPCGHTCNLDTFEAKFGDRLLLPVPPFTDIAFNTYTVAVIEAARPSGDSALQPSASPPPTGSPQGKSAGAPPVGKQPAAADLKGTPQGEPIAPAVPATPSDDQLSALSGRVNERLLKCRVGTGPYWKAVFVRQADGSVTASVSQVGDGPCDPAIPREAAEEVVRQEAADAGVHLGPPAAK